MANSVRFQLVPREAASRFESLPAPVRRLLRLCDGTRTVDEISASSQLDDDETQKVLDRLSALGLIAPQPAQKPPRRRRITPDAVRWLDGAPPAVAAPAPAAAPAVAKAEVPRAEVAKAEVAKAEVARPSVVVTPEPPLPSLAPEAPVAAPVPVAARVAAPAKPSAPKSTAFSDEEESFFSSSFDHLTKDEYAD